MKKIIILFALILCSYIGFCQSIVLTENNGASLSVNNGQGISLGSYTVGTVYTVTVCSSDPENLGVGLNIASYSFPVGSSLTVYNGTSTSGSINSVFNHNTVGGTVGTSPSADNESGCFTFVFTSTVPGASFSGALTLNFLCKQRTVELSSVPGFIVEDGDYYLNLCWNYATNSTQEVQFSAQGTYPADPGYALDDASVTFLWDFGDGLASESGMGLTNVSHTFMAQQGFTVNVRTKDSKNCFNNNVANLRVRVARSPKWNSGTSGVDPNTICMGQPASACCFFSENPWESYIIPVVADVIQLPDGNGICYESPITQTQLSAGALVSSTTDIQSICTTISHTYLGDLKIYIICPNGSTVQLQEQGGGGIDLGLPSQGIGYEYCWTNTATQTMSQAAANSGSTLPPGSFKPYDGSFNGLIGCPLNGLWTFKICDHWLADSGTNYGWFIKFKDELYPEPWEYNLDYTIVGWTGGYGSVISDPTDGNCVNATYVTTSTPNENSVQFFNFQVRDEYGCLHDTLLTINVKHGLDPDCCFLPSPNAGPDASVCGVLVASLSASLATDNNGEWQLVSGPGTAQFQSVTSSSTSVTVSMYGEYVFAWNEYHLGNTLCTERDEVVVKFLEDLDPEISPISDICASSPSIQIQAINYGLLSCSPNEQLLDTTTYMFNPSIPGEYTITNVVNNPCTEEEITSTQTFTVFDNIVIANHLEECVDVGTNQNIQISWQVQGVLGNPISDYNVDGVAQSSTNFSTSIPSPSLYSYTVTDNNGCSAAFVQGFRDCGCPLYAGTMQSLELVLLCEGECTSVNTIPHNGNQVTAADAGVFGFILHSGDNVPIRYSDTPTFCQEDLALDVTYYISPVCGYPDEEGKAILSECYSISPGTRIRWTKSTAASAGDDQEVCGLQVTLSAQVMDFGDGYWTSASQFIPINGTSIVSPNMEVLVTEIGEVTFTWHVVNGNCEARDDVVVRFLEAPMPFAGQDQVVCGNQVELEGVASNTEPGATFTWQNPSGVVVFAPNDQLITTASSSFFGTYEMQLTEYRDGCVGTSSTLVTFIKKPSPSIMPGLGTICGNYVYLDALTDPDASGLWIAYSLDEANNVTGLLTNVNYSPSPNNPHTVATISSYDGTTKKVKFTWKETKEQNGKQCEDSVSRVVNFAKEPNAGVVFDHLEVCDNCVDLQANVSGSLSVDGLWVAKVSGEFTNEGGASSENSTFCIDSLAGFETGGVLETSIFWTVSNPDAPGCTSSAPVYVKFYKRPVANAGFDNAVCGLEGQLQASPSFVGSSGVWKTYLQPDNSTPAAIANANAPTSAVSVPDFGIWGFEYNEKNTDFPTCDSRDSVIIEFVAKPVISAGENLDVCGQETILNATPGGFEGSWLNTSGAVFSDQSDPHSQVNVNSYGAFEFTWQESNSATTFPEVSCTSNDKVTLTFYQQPQAQLFSTTDSIDKTCGFVYSSDFSFSGNQLRVSQPSSNQIGFWRTQSSGVSFGENNSGVNSWDTYATVSSYGVHEFEWVLKAGESTNSNFDCQYVAGPISVTFVERPIADAGEDITFCALSGNLGAVIPSPGTGVWTTPSETNIVVEDASSPNSKVNSEVYNTDDNPKFKLYWTVNNDGCTNTDSVNVTFAPKPTSDFQVIPPKCFGQSAIIKAEDITLNKYTWNFNGGVVEQSFSNEEGGVHTNLVYWTDEADTHSISLIAENTWECPSSINTANIQEPAKPLYTAVIIKDTCNLKKGGIKLIDDDNLYSFFWTDPNFGPAVGTPITIVNNIPAGDYNIKTSYVSFNAVDYDDQYTAYFGSINCESLVEYTIPSMGAIKAKFEISPEIILEDLTAPEGKVVFLNKTDYDGVKKRCIWKFGDGEVEKKCDELMEHIYTQAGCFYPELIVYNKELPECSDTAKLANCILVKDHSELEIPNIFSPNGDGINDYFQVKATSLRSFVGVIVNRWGKEVYTWTDWKEYTSGWDGKIRGGSEASAGVYYYIIKAEGIDGQEYETKGVLHLMRE